MITINNKNINACGTSLIGYLNMTYDEIVFIFGNPIRLKGGDNKVEWEWVFKLNDTVLTIYNWKNGPSYTGKRTIKARDIKDWHVGGRHTYDLKILKDYICSKNEIFTKRYPLVMHGRLGLEVII